MDIVVMGANGRLGRAVSRRLSARGHRVRAVVRGAEREVAPGAEKGVGDPCDAVEVARLVRGADAVVSTLGPQMPTRAACAVYPRSGKALVAGLAKAGVGRLVVTSTGLLFPPDGWTGRLLRAVVPNVAVHAARMEASVRESALDWTIVRTDFLTDGVTGVRVLEGGMPAGPKPVGRDAVAEVLVEALETGRYGRATLGVCGPR